MWCRSTLQLLKEGVPRQPGHVKQLQIMKLGRAPHSHPPPFTHSDSAHQIMKLGGAPHSHPPPFTLPTLIMLSLSLGLPSASPPLSFLPIRGHFCLRHLVHGLYSPVNPSTPAPLPPPPHQVVLPVSGISCLVYAFTHPDTDPLVPTRMPPQLQVEHRGRAARGRGEGETGAGQGQGGRQLPTRMPPQLQL